MPSLRVDIENTKELVTDKRLQAIEPEILNAKKQLDQHTGPGSDFHGWTRLPFQTNHELELIKEIAAEIKDSAGSFICIGIGGSYLGAQATISALKGEFYHLQSPQPRVHFAGQHLSSRYLEELIELIDFRNVYLNIISKSGTTTEPGLVFRILSQKLVAAVGEATASRRIIATTDKEKGGMRTLANEKGYRTLVIPDDVGGRFSVLTPVGLLPIAVAGIDIEALLAGARDMASLTRENSLEKNPSLLYAAVRNILLRQGKVIEILANFESRLHYISEWWKQLFGESEGKNGKGLFPAAVDLTTDLHSLGQLIQDGPRNLFELFLILEENPTQLTIPATTDNYDGFNYIAGQTMAYVNHQAYEATALAHREGGCPNLTLFLPQLTAYWLGQLFYFFEYAVAISGYVLGVNPFVQPGVENYKTNMFKLLGKPGF